MTTDHIPFSELHHPWDENENVIWLGSTLKLLRNIDKCKFPQKLDVDRKKQILTLLTKAFAALPELTNPYTIGTEEMSPMEREFLTEHFLLFEGFQEAGVGSAVGLDKTGECIALFNFKDHIMLQKIDISGDLEKCWADLVKIENDLSRDFNYAFSEKYGFLTADPFQCGTAFIVSSFLHVPALIHTNSLLDILEREKGDGIIATGIQGNPDELVGDLLMVKNKHTLGVNEETIVSTVRNAVLHFVLAEKEARQKIKTDKPAHVIDLIARAIGLLKHSYQLEVPETLGALSVAKLGVEIGWLTGISVKEVNRLLFDCRRSHLRASLARNTPSDAIVLKRAEYLQRAIEGAKLVVT